MIVFGLAAVNKSVFVSACPLFHVRLRLRRSGNLRGSNNQKSGKCHELSRKSIKFVFTNPTGGGGVPGGGGVGGQHFKSPVNFMNCRENR